MDESSYDFSLETPVALVIFRRTGPVERVLDVLRKVEPPEVYLIADGPREGIEGEAEQVRNARAFVEANIDWDCTIKKNYSDENMGGPRRIPTGLDWVFENVDKAIILEEDMLPAPEFFEYCERLLNRYEDNPKIMGICGNNAGSAPDVESSYFFANFHRTMGWATWRRAWDKFDPTLERWPEMRENEVLKDRYHMDVWAENHAEAFDFLYDEDDERNYWDATWQYCIVANDGETILPTRNLVVHIGYGEGATHTDIKPVFRQLLLPNRETMSFPLDHPDEIETSLKFEQNYNKYKRGRLMNLLNLMDRALYKILP
jgi:hypothetical protein